MTRLPILALSFKSLRNRRVSVGLTIFAIGVSVMLLLGVEKIRSEAKASFANTISGTDLIVGARSGAIQLLLYSVFRIGNATNNISWRSYREIADRPEVAWTIPITLGDSHRGYRVLGTSQAYFEHFRYGRKQPLAFAEGRPFEDVFDAVLGAEVARTLGYGLEAPLVIAHGLGQEGFATHEDKPFTVVGILAPTGTPVDRTVHVSLEGYEAIHVDWRGGGRLPGLEKSAEEVRGMTLQPRAITAFLVGLDSKLAIFGLQRLINEYRREPLLAILPGVALQELWALMATAEAALAIISGFVVAAGLLGMATMLLSGLNERRREMAILRALGARPRQIFGLFLAEATILTGLGALLGLALLYGCLFLAGSILETRFGLFLAIGLPSGHDLLLLSAVIAAGLIVGILPAIFAYRQSLADGMVVRA